MKHIIIDNIIFYLQKAGGISVYWYELLKRLKNSDYDITYIEQKNESENIFKKLLLLSN